MSRTSPASGAYVLSCDSLSHHIVWHTYRGRPDSPNSATSLTPMFMSLCSTDGSERSESAARLASSSAARRSMSPNPSSSSSSSSASAAPTTRRRESAGPPPTDLTLDKPKI